MKLSFEWWGKTGGDWLRAAEQGVAQNSRIPVQVRHWRCWLEYMALTIFTSVSEAAGRLAQVGFARSNVAYRCDGCVGGGVWRTWSVLALKGVRP